MSKWKPALALLLVFMAGLVLGVVGTGLVVTRVVRQIVNNPQYVPTQVELRLVRQLRLTPAQRVRVREILMDSQQRLQAWRQQTQPARAEILSNASAQITLILTPQQQKAFERLKAENRTFFSPSLPPPPQPN